MESRWLHRSHNTLMACRDAVSPEVAPSLPLQAKANPKHENYVDDACQLGAKTTVAAGCMLGRGTTLGDKCSVKRSVLGHLCKVGSGVRWAHLSRDIRILGVQGTTLGNKCSVKRSVLGHLCKVGSGVQWGHLYRIVGVLGFQVCWMHLRSAAACGECNSSGS